MTIQYRQKFVAVCCIANKARAAILCNEELHLWQISFLQRLADNWKTTTFLSLKVNIPLVFHYLDTSIPLVTAQELMDFLYVDEKPLLLVDSLTILSVWVVLEKSLYYTGDCIWIFFRTGWSSRGFQHWYRNNSIRGFLYLSCYAMLC